MVFPRIVPAALLVALVACGGGSTEPVEPPLQQVSRIAYATDAALVFTGHTVAVRDLVKAYDAAGAELPSSMLSLTLPAGWTLVGDSLHSPSAERVGGFRATPKVSRSLASSGARFEVGDVATDSTVLTAGIDLRAFAIAGSFRCVFTAPHIYAVATRGGWPLDSVQVDVVADSVVYPGDSSYVHNVGGVAQVWFTRRSLEFVREPYSRVDTTTGPMEQTIARQAPDSLLFDGKYVGAGDRPAVKTASATYAGVSWCGVNTDRADPVILTLTPK
ncbi:MAG TPA: hypothetical protein VFZ21_02595 [Gemmatimonadaceae bacterium]|nr:hypothetical protein [Gemmatimonadaceae bacterium]